MDTQFEWDEIKALRNLVKHGVGFEEATTVFNDEFVATMPDPAHSGDEDRYVGIGMSTRGRLLTVIFTARGPGIRIISCRKAPPRERNAYEEDQ